MIVSCQWYGSFILGTLECRRLPAIYSFYARRVWLSTYCNKLPHYKPEVNSEPIVGPQYRPLVAIAVLFFMGVLGIYNHAARYKSD